MRLLLSLSVARVSGGLARALWAVCGQISCYEVELLCHKQIQQQQCANFTARPGPQPYYRHNALNLDAVVFLQHTGHCPLELQTKVREDFKIISWRRSLLGSTSAQYSVLIVNSVLKRQQALPTRRRPQQGPSM